MRHDRGFFTIHEHSANCQLTNGTEGWNIPLGIRMDSCIFDIFLDTFQEVLQLLRRPAKNLSEESH